MPPIEIATVTEGEAVRGILRVVLMGLIVPLSVQPAAAAIITWLDYNHFELRLSELASTAGVEPFTGSEVAQLKTGIKSGLERAYSPFAVTFAEAQPEGLYETIRFGTTTVQNILGTATRSDYRNQYKDDVAQVYTSKFKDVLTGYTSSLQRAEQLSRLTTALASTAAHELGHNLGLMHKDAYSGIIYTGGTADSGGIQNQHLMATGVTGLTADQRASERTFTDRSRVKLAYADGLLADTPASLLEQSTPHNTLLTAQPVVFTPMTVAPLWAANIVASIGSPFEVDLYRIDALAGTLVSADIASHNIFANMVDTTLTLLDLDGTTILAMNESTRLQGDVFGRPPMESHDAVLFNVLLPETGSYFLKVHGYSNDTGLYELLITATLPTSPALESVPEPRSLVLAGGLACLLLARVRRQRLRAAFRA